MYNKRFLIKFNVFHDKSYTLFNNIIIYNLAILTVFSVSVYTHFVKDKYECFSKIVVCPVIVKNHEPNNILKTKPLYETLASL